MTVEERVRHGKYDIDEMTPKEMAQAGEFIIFGRLTQGAPTGVDVGKGLCPLCHTVTGISIRDAAPDLTANEKTTRVPIALRGEHRIRDPNFSGGASIQKESRPGSGRAKSNLEYIVESHTCPSCYVVSGFGKKGTQDRESPMIALHAPPNCQSIEEAIMIDTYLYVKDGLPPPSPAEIRTSYEKFLPFTGPSAPGC